MVGLRAKCSGKVCLTNDTVLFTMQHVPSNRLCLTNVPLPSPSEQARPAGQHQKIALQLFRHPEKVATAKRYPKGLLSCAGRAKRYPKGVLLDTFPALEQISFKQNELNNLGLKRKSGTAEMPERVGKDRVALKTCGGNHMQSCFLWLYRCNRQQAKSCKGKKDTKRSPFGYLFCAFPIPPFTVPPLPLA